MTRKPKGAKVIRLDVKRGSRARAKEPPPPPPPPVAPDVAERVNLIAQVMREGLWVRGVTGKDLAVEWGLHQKTVEDDAAEAWRRVCAEANDATLMQPTIAGTLAVALAQAADSHKFKEVASLGDTLSKIIGARAPERKHVSINVQHYAQLSDDEMLERVEAKLVELTELRARLLAKKAIPALPAHTENDDE